MKIVIKANNDRVLILWLVTTIHLSLPQLVELLTHIDLIPDWYHGKYFLTIDEALAAFNKVN